MQIGADSDIPSHTRLLILGATGATGRELVEPGSRPWPPGDGLRTLPREACRHQAEDHRVRRRSDGLRRTRNGSGWPRRGHRRTGPPRARAVGPVAPISSGARARDARYPRASGSGRFRRAPVQRCGRDRAGDRLDLPSKRRPGFGEDGGDRGIERLGLDHRPSAEADQRAVDRRVRALRRTYAPRRRLVDQPSRLGVLSVGRGRAADSRPSNRRHRRQTRPPRSTDRSAQIGVVRVVRQPRGFRQARARDGPPGASASSQAVS